MAGGEPRPIVVLVVDDEPEIRLMLTEILQDEGFVAHAASDTASGLAAIADVAPDVVLLDVGMPSMNGLDMLTEIRRRGELPVILVTGRGGETDRVVGLRMGADDYVVKPFSSPELVARIHSVVRRSRSAQIPVSNEERVDFGRLRIDPVTREVHLDDVEVHMTAREFDLLAFLVKEPRRVFTREQLLSQVWESSTAWQDPATVTEHIRRIRRKIEDDPDSPRWLTTVRGVGYRFEP
jgi:two-component system phosphate regulon response regulator PhoB